MVEKKRLDIILVEQDIFKNRSKAKRAIMAGQVKVNNEIVDKAGTQVNCDADIVLKGKKSPYVSRGGLKLEKALKVFNIDLADKKAIDIGASTGGFTDCLLQKGAIKVYAIDVGYGQLAWKLRKDKRVVVIERTNFRYIEDETLPEKVPLIVTDVSFISLKLIIPKAVQFLQSNGDIITLIKPQFEAGPERVGKNGVVRDRNVHRDVITEIITFIEDYNLILKGLDYSPITGASSNNIEFLMHAQLNSDKNYYRVQEDEIERVVNDAHRELIKR